MGEERRQVKRVDRKPDEAAVRNAAESWQRHQQIADLVGQIRTARRRPAGQASGTR